MPPKVKDMKAWRIEQKEKKRKYREAMEWKQAQGTWKKERPKEKVNPKEQKKVKPSGGKEKPAKNKKDGEADPAKDADTVGDVAEKKIKKRKNTEQAQETLETEVPEVPQKKKKQKKAEDSTKAQAEDNEESVPRKKQKKKATDAAEDAEEGGEVEVDPEAFKVVVAGFLRTLEERQVRKHFSKCGEILSLRLLTDRDTRQSRGIAFISFTDQAGQDAALEMNGDEFKGRSLLVQKAESKAKGQGKGQGPGQKPKGCKSVVVKGLAFTVTEADLMKIFKQCGDGPTNIKVQSDWNTGASRGIAFVDFDSETGIDEAIKLNGTVLKGRRFSMDYARPRW